VTRPRGMQDAVGDRHGAVPTPRADEVQVAADVDRAAEVAEAGADAAAETHAPVARPLDHHDLVLRRTRHVQRLHRTVVDRRHR